MKGFVLFFFLAALIRSVVADVSMVYPIKDSVFSGASGTFSVKVGWRVQDHQYPLLDDIKIYNVSLCAGLPEQLRCIGVVAQDVLPKDLKKDGDVYYVDAVIDPGYTVDGAYIMQVTANAGSMGYTITYSERFYLTNMSGQRQGLDVSMYDVIPYPEMHITADASGEPINTNELYAKTEYAKQTWPTRFAPMQPEPLMKITATTWTRQFPTSSVSYFSVLIKSVDQLTTITASRTYSISTAINSATPAPFPSENGSWYIRKDATTRTSPRKINLHRASSAPTSNTRITT